MKDASRVVTAATRGRTSGLLVVALLVIAGACAERTPTAPSAGARVIAPAASDPVPAVTISYVCGRTFQVDIAPLIPVMMVSGGVPGPAFYQPAPGTTTYVNAGGTESSAGIIVSYLHPPVPNVASLFTQHVGCPSSPTAPPPGTFTLKHFCSESWVLENRSPVAYRLQWGSAGVPAWNELGVPAATAAGPARLYFGTNFAPYIPLNLYFNEQLIAHVVPDREFRLACKIIP